MTKLSDFINVVSTTITGRYIGSSATFIGLPTTSTPTGAAVNGDWAVLTTDIVGTGTVLNPQYDSGVYVYNGTSYSFAFTLSASSVLVAGRFIGSAATFAALPITSVPTGPAVSGDWATLTAVDGANVAGVYRYDGAVYSFAFGLGDATVRADVSTVLGVTLADGDLGTFTGVTIADDVTVKAALQALETAVEGLGGKVLGFASTFAALPASTTANTWAILTTVDGANGRGIYRHNGTAWVFVAALGSGSGVARTISGSVTATGAEGATSSLFITLAAGTQLATVSATGAGAVAEIRNARSGRIEVIPGTANVVVSHTTSVWQRAISAGVQLVNGAASVTFDATQVFSGFITLAANQVLASLTATNATVTQWTASGSFSINPTNAGDVVLTATLSAVSPTDRCNVANYASGVSTVVSSVIAGTNYQTAYASQTVLALGSGSTVKVDPSGMVNNSNFTIKKFGRYVLEGKLDIEYTDALGISVGVNSVQVRRFTIDPVFASDLSQGIHVDLGDLNVGDVVDIRATGHSGTTLLRHYSVSLIQVPAGFVVPLGTVVRTACVVTPATGTINGTTSAVVYGGTSARVTLAPAAGQQLNSVTTSAGLAAAVSDKMTGAVEIACVEGTTSGTITPTFGPLDLLHHGLYHSDGGGSNVALSATGVNVNVTPALRVANVSAGGITHAAGVWTIPAGKWQMEAWLNDDANTTILRYRFYNVTTGEFIGAFGVTHGDAASWGGSAGSAAFVSSATSFQVAIRVTTAGGTLSGNNVNISSWVRFIQMSRP